MNSGMGRTKNVLNINPSRATPSLLRMRPRLKRLTMKTNPLQLSLLLEDMLVSAARSVLFVSALALTRHAVKLVAVIRPSAAQLSPVNPTFSSGFFVLLVRKPLFAIFS